FFRSPAVHVNIWLRHWTLHGIRVHHHGLGRFRQNVRVVVSRGIIFVRALETFSMRDGSPQARNVLRIPPPPLRKHNSGPADDRKRHHPPCPSPTLAAHRASKKHRKRHGKK